MTIFCQFQQYDACELVKKYQGGPVDILIDVGKADNFLTQGQLLPDNFVAACAESKVPVILRMQDVSCYIVIYNIAHTIKVNNTIDKIDICRSKHLT